MSICYNGSDETDWQKGLRASVADSKKQLSNAGTANTGAYDCQRPPKEAAEKE